MAKAVVVLCPPQSFPEAFVDFCQLRLQVFEPILLYSQAALKATAKRLSSLLNSSTLVCNSRWTRSSPAEYIDSIREVASRQAQDCVFLLSCEEMEQLCELEGAGSGTLGLQLHLSRGVEWTFTRSEFQAYLQVKLGESWRGEPIPQMDIQMHLATMRETILIGLKEELITQPGDYSTILSNLQVKITEIVCSVASQIERIHLSSIENIKEEAVRSLEEARAHFEATRSRLETQAQAVMQEQGELVSLLAEANEALRNSKVLKEKLSCYEEVNSQTQQVIHSLKQGPPLPQGPAPSVPPKPEKSSEIPLSFTGNVTFPKLSTTTPREPNEPPPFSKAYSVEVPAGKQGLKPTSGTTIPKSNPAALSRSSVVIEEIEQDSDVMANLVVTVCNKTTTAIEGANMHIAGSQQPIPDRLPILHPGVSKFKISYNCLPDNAEKADFLLCKGSQAISENFTVTLDHAESDSTGPPVSGIPSSPPAKPSHPPAKPSHPPAKPGYPPAKPGYSPDKPSHPPAKPGYPQAKPSYPPAKPSYPQTQPSYPPAKPSYPTIPFSPQPTMPIPQTTIPNPSPPPVSSGSSVSEVPGLTPEQSIRFSATLKLLGGTAQLATQEKIKKLVQNSAFEAMNPNQLLELIYST